MQADLAGEAVLSEIVAQIRDTLEAALCLEDADRNGSSKTLQIIGSEQQVFLHQNPVDILALLPFFTSILRHKS